MVTESSSLFSSFPFFTKLHLVTWPHFVYWVINVFKTLSTIITLVSGHVSVTSLEDMILTQGTHLPVVVNYHCPYREVTYTTHVCKFGQGQCVIAERRCSKEEDTRAFYSVKVAPHRGSVLSAFPEFAESEIWFRHFALYSLDLGAADPHWLSFQVTDKPEWQCITLSRKLGSMPNPPTFVIGKLHNFSKFFCFVTCAIGMLMLYKDVQRAKSLT